MICEFWTLSIVMDFLTLVPNSSLESVTNCEVGIFWSPGWLSSQLAYWLVVKVALFSAHMIRFGGQPNRQFIAVLPLLRLLTPPLHTILLVSLFSGY